MNGAHGQSEFGVRFEWGPAGARAISSGCDVAVVVDVLSFTTTLSVALDAGIEVLPYRFRDDAAAAYAEENDAVLAVGRSVARGNEISLSSPTIRDRDEHPERLVLPSPNGSTISYELAKSANVVVGACVRNADAVGEWICATYPGDATIAVVAAGEQWQDGEQWPDRALRPAVEDLWGAGAVLSAMTAHGWPRMRYSPEAETAESAWVGVMTDLTSRLEECASGRELIEAGYAQDVAIAGECNSSRIVPLLRNGRFVAGSDRVVGRPTELT